MFRLKVEQIKVFIDIRDLLFDVNETLRDEKKIYNVEVKG